VQLLTSLLLHYGWKFSWHQLVDIAKYLVMRSASENAICTLCEHYVEVGSKRTRHIFFLPPKHSECVESHNNYQSILVKRFFYMPSSSKFSCTLLSHDKLPSVLRYVMFAEWKWSGEKIQINSNHGHDGNKSFSQKKHFQISAPSISSTAVIFSHSNTYTA
jgi:hypothetical protein